jgi:hypothetical protein
VTDPVAELLAVFGSNGVAVTVAVFVVGPCFFGIVTRSVMVLFAPLARVPTEQATVVLPLALTWAQPWPVTD